MALNEKWISLIEANQDLIVKVLPLAPEEAQKVLAENGYEFTVEEIIEAGKEFYAVNQQLSKEGELSEDDLDAVAGGGWLNTVKKVCQMAGAAMQQW